MNVKPYFYNYSENNKLKNFYKKSMSKTMDN